MRVPHIAVGLENSTKELSAKECAESALRKKILACEKENESLRSKLLTVCVDNIEGTEAVMQFAGEWKL